VETTETNGITIDDAVESLLAPIETEEEIVEEEAQTTEEITDEVEESAETEAIDLEDSEEEDEDLDIEGSSDVTEEDDDEAIEDAGQEELEGYSVKIVADSNMSKKECKKQHISVKKLSQSTKHYLVNVSKYNNCITSYNQAN